MFKRTDVLPPPDRPRLNRMLEGVALLLIAASAILFQRSATSAWAEARLPAGNRVEISPIGVADYGPGTTGTAPVQCRWWPKIGNETLCHVAPDGASAMTRLKRAYPLTVAALWTAVLALFLVALRIPRRATYLGVIATAAVPLLAVGALWSMASSARTALAVLALANVQVAPRGFAPMFAGALLTALAVGLLLVARLKSALTLNLRAHR